jgi:hypothetical protein
MLRVGTGLTVNSVALQAVTSVLRAAKPDVQAPLRAPAFRISAQAEGNPASSGVFCDLNSISVGRTQSTLLLTQESTGVGLGRLHGKESLSDPGRREGFA